MKNPVVRRERAKELWVFIFPMKWSGSELPRVSPHTSHLVGALEHLDYDFPSIGNQSTNQSSYLESVLYK